MFTEPHEHCEPNRDSKVPSVDQECKRFSLAYLSLTKEEDWEVAAHAQSLTFCDRVVVFKPEAGRMAGKQCHLAADTNTKLLHFMNTEFPNFLYFLEVNWRYLEFGVNRNRSNARPPCSQ